MQTDVYVDSGEKSKALRRFISMRLKKALRRHANEVNHVDVKLRDVNGKDKKGIDKECTLLLKLEKNHQPLVAKAEHEDAGQAFRAALRKMLPKARQELARLRRSRKRSVVFAGS